MSGHTPEPWGLFRDQKISARLYPDGILLNQTDYDRAAICVNAFAGVENPPAEIRILKERLLMKNHADNIVTNLCQDNIQLRAEIEMLLGVIFSGDEMPADYKLNKLGETP